MLTKVDIRRIIEELSFEYLAYKNSYIGSDKDRIIKWYEDEINKYKKKYLSN